MDTPTKKTNIRSILEGLGAIRPENIEIFSNRTRDENGLRVYRDKTSKVIFIDDYYVGEQEYLSGEYRGEGFQINYEDVVDSERRLQKYLQFIVGKKVCDFGCGAGNFIQKASNFTRELFAIELQKNYLKKLNELGISAFSHINEIEGELDTVFLFHCFEHLPDPLKTLTDIKIKLKSSGGGKIILEVPHAKDFLIDTLNITSFIEFTLWSQHLILHTRESLFLMLAEAGFKNILIEGVQRYSLSNHLSWLINNKPGGHKEGLSIFETNTLTQSYADALSKIDANDTLVAIAST